VAQAFSAFSLCAWRSAQAKSLCHKEEICSFKEPIMTRPVFAAVLLIYVSAMGCARPGAVDAAKRQMKADALVTMSGFSFIPDHVTINAGQTVEWNNTAAIETHTVTADPKLAKNPHDVALPPGAEPFNSGDLKGDAIFRHTFTVPGVYRYFCIPHEKMGMIGEVDVKPATP
jgi:plastocyanin